MAYDTRPADDSVSSTDKSGQETNAPDASSMQARDDQSPSRSSRSGKKKKPFNPFYLALILIGIFFAITASAYFVMTIQKLNPEDATEALAVHEGLNGFLDKHGFTTMMIELGCLAVATFGAIGLDEIRDRRAQKNASKRAPGSES